jgi:peptide/nickel transport system substrate-binding protein
MSPDGKEIEFTLRKGVKFHSGDPLTVKDVQFSFDRGKAKNPLTQSRLRSVERFEAIDDYRYKIRFKTPDVTFIPNRGVWQSFQNLLRQGGEEEFGHEPVGTGPYKFVRHAPGEYVDIERFEDYWGEKPSVKEARFYFIPENTTRLAKLKSGEVDLIGNCPYPLVKDVEKSPGLKVVRLASNHPTVSVVFANRNPKTVADKRVRSNGS